ncbi:MAG: hypothetical protein JKY71_10660 [Alphaproteobacteria bacterium]|nr:hypothetical protein [Alphaproteobacteria bacterium]
MIRKYSLLAGLILAIGVGPALAQNIFVSKKYSGGKSDEKPTIYNKVDPNGFTEQQKVVKYGKRLNVKDQLAESKILSATLDEMREMGFKPSNAEEMILYANAHRAKHQNLMYQRRQKLIEYQNKVAFERTRQELLRTSQKSAFKAKKPVTVSKGQESDAEDTKTKTRVLKRKPVYVTKSADEKAKPTKVFTDY